MYYIGRPGGMEEWHPPWRVGTIASLLTLLVTHASQLTLPMVGWLRGFGVPAVSPYCQF